MTVTLPMGGLTATQLQLLADLTERFGDGFARTTVEQNITLRYVPTEKVAALYQELLPASLTATEPVTFPTWSAVRRGDLRDCPVDVSSDGTRRAAAPDPFGDDPGLTGASLHPVGLPPTAAVSTTSRRSACKAVCGSSAASAACLSPGRRWRHRRRSRALYPARRRLPCQRDGPSTGLLSRWKTDRQRDDDTERIYRSVPLIRSKLPSLICWTSTKPLRRLPTSSITVRPHRTATIRATPGPLA